MKLINSNKNKLNNEIIYNFYCFFFLSLFLLLLNSTLDNFFLLQLTWQISNNRKLEIMWNLIYVSMTSHSIYLKNVCYIVNYFRNFFIKNKQIINFLTIFFKKFLKILLKYTLKTFIDRTVFILYSLLHFQNQLFLFHWFWFF